MSTREQKKGGVMMYDSEQDTREHIRQVALRLKNVETELRDRGYFHDASKLGPNEKPIFDQVTPELKSLVYGSDEYKDSLKKLGSALEHHYQNNSHHPEHYPDGISGMDLLDLIEMYCDWSAAMLRDAGQLDDDELWDRRAKRFNIDPQLLSILRNTWTRHGGFCGYHNYHLENTTVDGGGWTLVTDVGTGQVFQRQPKPNQPI